MDKVKMRRRVSIYEILVQDYYLPYGYIVQCT